MLEKPFEIRWHEHDDVKKNSESAKHLKENENDRSICLIICNAPEQSHHRKI